MTEQLKTCIGVGEHTGVDSDLSEAVKQSDNENDPSRALSVALKKEDLRLSELERMLIGSKVRLYIDIDKLSSAAKKRLIDKALELGVI